jgi:hypothetical protein
MHNVLILSIDSLVGNCFAAVQEEQTAVTAFHLGAYNAFQLP